MQIPHHVRVLRSIQRRQTGVFDDDDGYWYYSPTAVAIKWAVLAALVLLLLSFLAGAYYHARRRITRGLQPMAYHRWMIPRRRYVEPEPHTWQPQNQFSFYHNQENGYQMHPVPPPAYNPNLAPPPVYQPPAGASKVNPSQHPPTMPAPPGEGSYPAPQSWTPAPAAQTSSVPGENHSAANPNPFR
ncbi:MAG: hypothetical protein M1816_001367 [Peltula sp. TS41687]|nr:MAG: hypothetical protein M1816_001367 [Peltula sp. TS41687]